MGYELWLPGRLPQPKATINFICLLTTRYRKCELRRVFLAANIFTDFFRETFRAGDYLEG
jgi:hypothetical protein